MATKTSQRVGIWIIAIAMVVGTIGTFGAMILQTENASKQARQQEDLYEQIYAQMREEAKNNEGFGGYEPSQFSAGDVSALVTKDLKKGTGDTVKEGDKLKMSYFGWTPSGEIFDSTKKKGADNAPAEFELVEGGLIEGWVKGVPGMKVGGVRELTIPATQAYGATGNEPLIAPDTPLKFIVRVEAITS